MGCWEDLVHILSGPKPRFIQHFEDYKMSRIDTKISLQLPLNKSEGRDDIRNIDSSFLGKMHFEGLILWVTFYGQYSFYLRYTVFQDCIKIKTQTAKRLDRQL